MHLIILLLFALGESQSTSCANIENLTQEQIWTIVKLTEFDRYFILTIGSIAVLLMILSVLSWFVYRSFNIPSDIMLIIAAAETL